MGDMADMALERAESDYEHYERVRNESLAVQYEEGLVDEHGTSTVVLHEKGPHGEGSCPVCGSETIKRTGQYGIFYGCSTFPSCKGSRGA